MGFLSDEAAGTVVAKLAQEHASLQVHYDTDYGIYKRTGWSVTVDGRVVVQFEETFGMAVALAYLKLQLAANGLATR